MRIERVSMAGFRNFADATFKLAGKTLIIGANDVGKTNLLHGIRLLLDRSIPETDLEPKTTDFHLHPRGQADVLSIEVQLAGVVEDALVSRLKGHLSSERHVFVKYEASREPLAFRLFIGHEPAAYEELDSRYYLKYLHFRYVESSRSLSHYIQREKRRLLRLAREHREEGERVADVAAERKLCAKLQKVADGINNLHYVRGATTGINEELQKLAHHHGGYEVALEAQELDFSGFVERLELGARGAGRSVGLGGDGRNNQILVGLWKRTSEVEHDHGSEAVIYCIEEPEAHLHPHQQRKLASYLINELPGQVIVTTHSPQIASEFTPDGVLRLFERNGGTVAARDGCSLGLAEPWQGLGYRMSVIPASAFFADAVLLVEGPSEVLFYAELARQIGIDLDFCNISLISVDGVDFGAYVAILNALEIPWVMRTDNDVSRVPQSSPPRWRFAGLNRALKIAGVEEYPDCSDSNKDHPSKIELEWNAASSNVNRAGIYISRVDLENDLGAGCAESLIRFAGSSELSSAVAYLQQRKAIRMGEFLSQHKEELAALEGDDLARPLKHAKKLAEKRRSEAKPNKRRGRS